MAGNDNKVEMPELEFGFMGMDPTKVKEIQEAASAASAATQQGAFNIGGGSGAPEASWWDKMMGSKEAGEAPEASWWDKMMGSKEAGPGWGNTVLNAALGLGNFYLGSEQLKLGKDSLATNKQQFADQFNIQKQNINRDIRDQGQARYDRNSTLNQDPDTYYEENKIK